MRANPPSILVVEDDANAREGLSMVLETEGFGVCCAENGQEALDLLQGGVRPSLMLVDLMLPLVSGWKLLKYVHEDPELRVVPAIVMTATANKEVHVIADEVFIKPINIGRLLDTVRRIVGQDIPCESDTPATARTPR
jgi:CheY-like chemotaxis protein